MLGALIGGCSADRTDATQSNRVIETPLVLPEAQVVSPPPATALTVLPSVNEVLVAVPEGRIDPFCTFPETYVWARARCFGRAGLEGSWCDLCG